MTAQATNLPSVLDSLSEYTVVITNTIAIGRQT